MVPSFFKQRFGFQITRALLKVGYGLGPTLSGLPCMKRAAGHEKLILGRPLLLMSH